jgi:TRAP-type C4-dicarboxylate transport system substrate-binding protein
MNKSLFGTVAALGIMAANTALADTRLVVNCFWPPQHDVCTEILPTWLAGVERVTEGRVKGNIPPRSVAPPPEQLASVEKGIVDAAIQFNGLIGNRVNGALVAMQPFSGGKNAEAMSQALWETNRKFFPDEFDTVELLTQWAIVPGELFSMTDKPITTVEDMQSLKIWTLPGPVTAMATALGAGAVATPAVQSNEVISRGVVDAHFGLGGDAVESFQVLPYTKSMTAFQDAVYTTSFSFFINKDKWAEISPEDQEAIRGVSGVGMAQMAGAVWDRNSSAVYARFPELGIPVVDADPALEQALKDAAEPITAKWIADATAAGIDAQGALDFYKARVAELSK